MFVSRRDWECLSGRLKNLEESREKANARFHEAEKKHKRLASEVETLENGLKEVYKQVKKTSSRDYGIFSIFSTSDSKIESFTLRERVDAIMDHLGLQELAEGENKLINKPVEKKKKGKK